MRFIMSIIRISASLVVLALLWAVLFGDGALRLHFLTPAYAAPLAGHHPYHLSNAIVYVSDSELWFLRGFTWGVPIVAFFLGLWTFSILDRKPPVVRPPAFPAEE